MVPFDARYDADELGPWLMNIVEKIFAAGMVIICVLLLVRMFLRPRRRARVDATLRYDSVGPADVNRADLELKNSLELVF